MSGGPRDQSASALTGLIAAGARFKRIDDKALSKAVIDLAKLQAAAPGQKVADLQALRAAIGDEFFAATIAAMSAHQLRLLARRLDKNLKPEDVESEGVALAHVRRALGLVHNFDPAPVVEDKPAASIDASPAPDEPAAPEPEPAAPSTNSYFGRKAFRTGD